MTDRNVKNMAASVHQRLLNSAKQAGRPFNELLQYYVIERFLYRLSKSAYADRFFLKGALTLLVWRTPTPHGPVEVTWKAADAQQTARLIVHAPRVG